MNIARILVPVAIALTHMSAASAVIFQDNFDGNQPGLGIVPIGGWMVSGGTVDIHGPGFFDLIPGNGLYVDLEGTKNAGALSRTFTLTTAATYTATYTLAGGRLSFDPTNVVDVQFGSATSTHRLSAVDGPTTYSLTFQPSTSGEVTLTFSNQGVDDWGAFLLDVAITGPVAEQPKPPPPTCADYLMNALSPVANGATMRAAFSPGTSLSLVATECGVKAFNWQQWIEILPTPNPYFAKNVPFPPLKAPPRFLDPIPGGIDTTPRIVHCRGIDLLSDLRSGDDAFPFYYSDRERNSMQTTDVLRFEDTPSNGCLTGKDPTVSLEYGDFMRFSTALVGEDDAGALVELPIENSWEWITTYNGTSGGTFNLKSLAGEDVGSGSGAARILVINGVSVVEEAPTVSLVALALVCVASLVLARRPPTPAR